jgi:transposase InsO family protein
MNTTLTLSEHVGKVAACQALDVARASLYRFCQPASLMEAPQRPAPPRALGPAERQTVLAQLNSERFVDQAPAQVYATLLDEGQYLCSVRTMYRILDQHDQVRERRNQLSHPAYQKPELLATGPNQIWSGDITKLLGPAKWTYFYLYVILDIFSRYAVGWMVASRESATLAQKLIRETCPKQRIAAGQLTVHADRGSSMTSGPVALLLGRSGSHQNAQPALQLQRQSVLRVPLQNVQVPARVSRSFWLHPGRPKFLSTVLLLVQHRASSFRPGLADSPGRSWRPVRSRVGGPAEGLESGFPDHSGTLRSQTAAVTPTARQSLDQPSRPQAARVTNRFTKFSRQVSQNH